VSLRIEIAREIDLSGSHRERATRGAIRRRVIATTR
jgi:hypothetical protein